MDAGGGPGNLVRRWDEPPETDRYRITMDTTGEIVVDESDGMFDAVEAALSGTGSPVSEILRHI